MRTRPTKQMLIPALSVLLVAVSAWGEEMTLISRDQLLTRMRERVRHMAERYAEIFALFLKHQDKIKRVTF